MKIINSKNLIILTLIIILLTIAVNIKDAARYFYPLQYKQTIEKYAEKYNLDPLFLAAIIKSESNFDPDACSKKGARGLMQIMPETGKWIASKKDIKPFHPDDLYAPETNIRIGAWYASNLLSEFDNELTPMLAAYNGGQGNVKKWLVQKSREEKQLTESEIPFPETRGFVKKVKKAYKIYKYLY
ncbi:MAG: lytic transglycosylase domain-containing protein [Clostridiales bacterium]|nr:lytic transglycosylase domain-containing protein [Clostridiales bacterium]MCF8022364.1 lytic transglycosylase domain-containing protein [Clostridiales bacterium]